MSRDYGILLAKFRPPGMPIPAARQKSKRRGEYTIPEAIRLPSFARLLEIDAAAEVKAAETVARLLRR